MFRIDNSTAVQTMPTPSPVGTPGYFTAGNVAAGQLATEVTADWANAVQEEIAHVIEGAGMTLDKQNMNQLYEALQTFSSEFDVDNFLALYDSSSNVTAEKNASGKLSLTAPDTAITSSGIEALIFAASTVKFIAGGDKITPTFEYITSNELGNMSTWTNNGAGFAIVTVTLDITVSGHASNIFVDNNNVFSASFNNGNIEMATVMVPPGSQLKLDGTAEYSHYWN